VTSKPPFNYSFNDDHSVVTLDLGGKTFDLTTEQLQVTILWLGQVRSEMTPAVTTEPTAAEPIAPIANWRVEPLAGGLPAQVGGRIAFRSIHFGWFAIPLSAEGFRHLGGGLFGAPVAKPPDATVQ
jgi:hypothetical protein